MNIFLRGLLSALGLESHVLTRSRGPAESREMAPGVFVHRLPCGYQQPWDREKACAQLPDFLQACRSFLARQSFQLFSAHYWMSALVARELLPGAPWRVMFHTLQATKKGPPDRLAGIRQQCENDVARRWPVAFLTYEDLRRSRALLPPLRAPAVIPPGLTGPFRPHPRAQARERLGLPQDAHLVVAAGRDDPVKNFSELQLPGSLLVLAGPPPSRSPHVLSLGPLPHEEMPWLFSAADLVLCPSEYETFGLVTLEALACGALVRVREGCYWARIFRATGCGLVGDEPLHDESEMRRRALGVAAHFSWERSARRWRSFLGSDR